MKARSWALVAIPAALIVVHAASPAAFDAGTTLINLYYGVALLCGALAIAGLTMRRPQPLWPWAAIAATVILWIAADVTYDTVGGQTTPSAADILYIGGYLTLIAGLWHIAKSQTSRRRLDQVLDLAVPYLGSGYAIWQLVIAPTWMGSDLPVLERIVTSSYPLADVVVAVLILQIVFTSGRRTVVTLGLGIAAVSLLVADAGYAIVAATDSYSQYAQPLDSLWLLTYLGLAAAVAWSATQRAPAGPPPTRLGVPQALVGATAIMIVPTTVAINQVLDQPSNALGLFVTMAAMLAISGWRFIRLSTTAVRAHQEVQQREHYYRVLALNSSDVVMVLDDTNAVIDVSRAILGLSDTPFEPAFRADPLSILHADDRADIAALLDAARGRPGQSVTGEARLRSPGPGPEQLWMEFRLTYLPDDPIIAGLIVNVRDITERKQVEAQLHHQVLHDGLTGLANRALFRDRVDHALARLHRHGGGVTIMFCNVDRFKEVNEQLGQQAGDQLLQQVGQRLQQAVRADDTVARLGSDEFAILLDSVGDLVATTDAAIERVTSELGHPFDAAGTLVGLTCSIGIASTDAADATSDQLLRNTDLALHHAKRNGRDRSVTYTPEMGEEAANRRQLEHDLRSAIAQDELVLHYQPLVDLSTSSLRGFEALVRWNHPRRGLLMPIEFIGIAEDTGLIVEIGDWVLRTACEAAADWSRRYPSAGDLEIAVNVSACQLSDPRLTRRVLGAVEAAGLDPRRLVLELTESVLVDQPDEANAHFEVLCGSGVRIAVDDFGTGYSSLPYLQQFSVDIIKIDRSFINDITGDHVPPLVRGMLDLSRSLGAACVAEGIEEPHQVTALLRAGCQIGQGYLYSRPIPPEEALALVGQGGPINAGSPPNLTLRLPR